MKTEMIRLLKHYEDVADNIKKDRGNKDFKQKVRENARLHADQILDNYPGIKEVKGKK